MASPIENWSEILLAISLPGRGAFGAMDANTMESVGDAIRDYVYSGATNPLKTQMLCSRLQDLLGRANRGG